MNSERYFKLRATSQCAQLSTKAPVGENITKVKLGKKIQLSAKDKQQLPNEKIQRRFLSHKIGYKYEYGYRREEPGKKEH